MILKIEPGKYVIAVSGGVDSMTLLNLLTKQSGVDLIIAHFNHGIRRDSAADEKLVSKTARRYGLPLEIGYGHLNKQASEAEARQARYDFLEKIRKKHIAKAIITAHHQDDLIETAILNLLRGTKRKGLTAIAQNPKILRPLLNISKKEILSYAQKSQLDWHEDSTNLDTNYLRNYIRLNIAPRLSAQEKEKLLNIISKTGDINKQIDKKLQKLSGRISKNGSIQRHAFIMLPVVVADELLAHWLRARGVNQFNERTIRRLNTVLRTAKSGTRHPVADKLVLIVDKQTAHFSHL